MVAESMPIIEVRELEVQFLPGPRDVRSCSSKGRALAPRGEMTDASNESNKENSKRGASDDAARLEGNAVVVGDVVGGLGFAIWCCFGGLWDG